MIVFPGSTLELKASEPTWFRVPAGRVAGNNLCCERPVPDPLQFCFFAFTFGPQVFGNSSPSSIRI
jgi:hypothetical protein